MAISEWREQALCAQVGQDNWIPEDGLGSSTIMVKMREAKKICARCPVIEECLNYALSMTDILPYGVWGGTDHYDRQRMRPGQRSTGMSEAIGRSQC